MAEGKRFVYEVEKAKDATERRPSVGPVYRSVFAKDGFPPPVDGMDSCWDVFRISVEKHPGNRMLGHREVVNGKAGKYLWLTYKEVYDMVIKVGLAIRSCGVEQGGRCGIYGANCPEWIVSMEDLSDGYLGFHTIVPGWHMWWHLDGLAYNVPAMLMGFIVFRYMIPLALVLWNLFYAMQRFQ